eukprot:7012426-Prymnesium_polylepis.2
MRVAARAETDAATRGAAVPDGAVPASAGAPADGCCHGAVLEPADRSRTVPFKNVERDFVFDRSTLKTLRRCEETQTLEPRRSGDVLTSGGSYFVVHTRMRAAYT